MTTTQSGFGGMRYRNSSRPARLAALAQAVVVVVLAASCAPAIEPPPASDPILSGSDLAAAVQFRASHGLRSDEAWILQVAADPASTAGVIEYGTPLTLVEKTELDQRARNTAQVGPAIEEYGRAHRVDYGGAYVDDSRGGVVVAQFTARLAEHEAALRRILHPEANFEVRQVRWSLAELERHFGDIARDADALRQFDAWFDRAGVNVRRNRVDLGISSRDPGAEGLVAAHYGNPAWLAVSSDGIGRWEGPRGTLVITAMDAAGRPVPFLDCVLTADEPPAWRGGISIGTDAEGVCEIEGAGATGYLIELRWYSASLGDWVTVGSARATVPPGGIARVKVEVKFDSDN